MYRRVSAASKQACGLMALNYLDEIIAVLLFEGLAFPTRKGFCILFLFIYAILMFFKNFLGIGGDIAFFFF